MKHDFDHAVKRFGTYSMKWDDDDFFRIITPNLRLDKDTIRLNLADMDFRCAPAIARAMHRVADFENFGYTTASSAPEYKPSIIGWYHRRHGVEIKPEWIVHSNGALDGVQQTILAFSQPGEGVILCRPIYRNFTSVIQQTGRHVANCQMLYHKNGRYEMDWEGLEQVCAQPENKVFVLCSSQNPVGRVWTREELARIAEVCRKNGVVVVSDEIHSDIVRKGVKHVPIIDAVEDLSNIIMVSGTNKTFNLMGLHCAYSIIPNDALREKFQAGYESAMPTAFALAGMIAAYNESEDWVDQLNDYLDDTIAAAAFVAEHSIVREIAAGRPDASDLAQAAAFGKAVTEKLAKGDETPIQVPGDPDYRKKQSGGEQPFHPTGGSGCVRCGACTKRCPLGAIPAEDPSGVIGKKCINCMRCVAVCPTKARKLPAPMLMAADAMLKKNAAVPRSPELFL